MLLYVIISLVVRWNDAIRVSMFVLVAICRVVKIYFFNSGRRIYYVGLGWFGAKE